LFIKTEPRKLEVDDLPLYSSWVMSYLGEDTKPRRFVKDAKKVKKEYEKEKWGRLEAFLSDEIDELAPSDILRRVADIVLGESKPAVYWRAGSFYFADNHSIYQAYLDYLVDVVCGYVDERTHLVDLGAGYGAFFLHAANKQKFTDANNLSGLELTKSGRNCGRLLMSKFGIDVAFGGCDFLNFSLNSMRVNNPCVFFTSWALALIQGYPRELLFGILDKKPRQVIHIEPLYELWSNNTVHECLWRKYLEYNDYNKTIYSSLRAFEAEGLIKITQCTNSEFGPNGLCPVSVIVWEPVP
jgi:hypothetical protein